MYTELRDARPRTKAVERPADVAWFQETATCRGEHKAGLTPVSAGREAFLQLSSPTHAQNAHQRSRDGQHGHRSLSFDLVQSKFSVDPV